MQNEQAGLLAKSLREIGFSDRAVTMILEQVEKVGGLPIQGDGLSEQAATYETAAEHDLRYSPNEGSAQSTNTLVIGGAVAALMTTILGWSALTSGSQADLAIMAGPAGFGPSWLQGAQAVLLAAWVAVPPLWSAWKGDLSERLRDIPALAIWCSITVVLATMLLASTG